MKYIILLLSILGFTNADYTCGERRILTKESMTVEKPCLSDDKCFSDVVVETSVRLETSDYEGSLTTTTTTKTTDIFYTTTGGTRNLRGTEQRHLCPENCCEDYGCIICLMFWGPGCWRRTSTGDATLSGVDISALSSCSGTTVKSDECWVNVGTDADSAVKQKMDETVSDTKKATVDYIVQEYVCGCD